MQKFTRNLTREVEIGTERLAVTFSAEGLSLRPVGSRRPPLNVSWAALLCTAVGQEEQDAQPSAEALAQALHRLKNPPKAKKSQSAPAAAPAEEAPPAASPPAHSAAPRTEGRLTNLMARVDRWLQQHRPRLARGLLPGATAEQLNQVQQQVGRPLPAELRELLSCHNGQGSEVEGAFENCFFLMSTAQIAEATRDLRADPPAGWQAGWVPFLEDDANSFVVIDTEQPGAPVREVWRGRTDHPVVAPSLTAWVQGFLDGLEKGAYVEDPERGTFLRKEPARAVGSASS
jgi:cell wall assembly regulator SMI1